jgi:hypothetical protein
MQNEPYFPQQPEPRRIPVLKIIGTILLVLIIICGGLVTYVAYNFRGWAAGFARGPLLAMVDEVGLPDEQKASIKQNLSRVADAFQSGRISYTQFTTIIEKLSQGPFFDLIQGEAMQHQYTLAHPQEDAERAETMLLFDRFERGVVENSIPRQQVQDIMALAHDPDQPHADGKSNTVTEAELKPFIDAMRKAVESAKISGEPFEPDFAAEIDRAVSAVLGPSTPATSTAPAEAVPQDQDTGGQAAGGTIGN